MIRIHVICEGQTEETFVKELLAPHFAFMDVYLEPALIGKPGHKGGRVNFDRLFTDARNRLLGDQTAFCTTFFDFYALPTDFPGKTEASDKPSINDKAMCVQARLVEALTSKLGDVAMQRFIPYVQMHEYEALLFSDPARFAEGISRTSLAPSFQAIRDEFNTPEEINDSPMTAPSKRVQNLAAGYEKPVYGTLAALEIGLDTIRRECLLFNTWLERIEHLKEEAC